jgi:hypothetical protein
MQHLQWPEDSVGRFSATYESWVSASEEVSVGHANSACMQLRQQESGSCTHRGNGDTDSKDDCVCGD